MIKLALIYYTIKAFRFINENELEPDIALLKPRSYRQAHPTADDVYLVIEFANTSLTKDTNEKRFTYASANIQNYWVANLRNRQLIVYPYPEEENYKLQQRLISSSISLLAFPDIALEIYQLLA